MKHASLFSGIGGPEIAAAMIGWENVFHCEINPFCRQILEYWFPKSESYSNIYDTDFKKWQGKIDVLTGGFPCQPFSLAGKRRGSQDNRYLWPQFMRAISEIQPTWIVGENVAGILSMVESVQTTEMDSQANLFDTDNRIYRYSSRQTFTIERICCDLQNIGYSVQPLLIPAAAVGAPHRRDRIFIIAHLEDSMHCGQLHGKSEKQECPRLLRDTCTRDSKRICTESQRSNVSNPYGSGKRTQKKGKSTKRNGCKKFQKPRQRQLKTQRPDGFSELPRTSTNPKCLRLQHDLDRRSKTSMFGTEEEGRQDCLSRQIQSSETDGSGGAFADTSSKGLERKNKSRCSKRRKRIHLRRNITRHSRQNDEIAGCGRWRNFPTVPPIFRGNDGIPFDVDCLSISFPKWRNESLKAYGNAIVPQVIYEIFRAIEIVSTDNNDKGTKQ